MKKIGILTFHYSNNYGAVLQALSLYKVVKTLGYDVEIINYIPSSYQPFNIYTKFGIKDYVFCNKINSDIDNILKKTSIKNKYCGLITNKFNVFRNKNMKLSEQVDENSLETILNNYSTIIVGSDQVWNPSQRKSPIYFLDFGNKYVGKKISYAADSTFKEVSSEDLIRLKGALKEFYGISVRNKHSLEFVKKILNKEPIVVLDPTLLFSTDNTQKREKREEREEGGKEEYILTYVLGKEIEGSHIDAINKIKSKLGNMLVYSIKIPTMDFDIPNYADKVFYDLDPEEWIDMIVKARFVYTDSFHGVLFSLKYHKPFLAYYTEKSRATRFIDIGKRYGIDKYIVNNIEEIYSKETLESIPSFNLIDNIIEEQKKTSLKFLMDTLLE